MTQLRLLTRNLLRRACALDSTLLQDFERDAYIEELKSEIHSLRRDGQGLRDTISRLTKDVGQLEKSKRLADTLEKRLRKALGERESERTYALCSSAECRGRAVGIRNNENDGSEFRAPSKPVRREKSRPTKKKLGKTNGAVKVKIEKTANKEMRRTPSERYLLSLQPNLSLSDSEEEWSDVVDKNCKPAIPRTPSGSHPIPRLNGKRMAPTWIPKYPVVLNNLPWEDTLLSAQSPLSVITDTFDSVVSRSDPVLDAGNSSPCSTI